LPQANKDLLRMFPYERFDAWKAAHALALSIYRATDEWPKSERFELTTQLRRAALSVPSNIAEGSAKYGSREFRRALDISLGSLAEISYYLLFARHRGLISHREWKHLNAMRDHAGRLVWGLLRAIRKGQS
jgi:four helix bundle protein